MKTILFVLFTISFSFAQDISEKKERFFLNTNLRSNLTSASNLGFGLKVSLGYKITDDFSIMLSSGYMTGYTKPHSYLQSRIYDINTDDYRVTTVSNGIKEHKFIPIDLSVKYNFNLFGLQTYALVQAGWDISLNEGNYTVSTLTKFESTNQLIESRNGLASDLYNVSRIGTAFGLGFGFGVLVPISNATKLDISYIYLNNLGIHSLGFGLNFGIK